MRRLLDLPLGFRPEALNASARSRIAHLAGPIPNNNPAIPVVVQHDGDNGGRPGWMPLTAIGRRRDHTFCVEAFRDCFYRVPSSVQESPEFRLDLVVGQSKFETEIEKLNQRVEQQARERSEQCHRIHHAEGRAGGASAGDPRGTRPQVGSRQAATPESPPAGRVKSEAASQRDVGQPRKAILTHSR
jgi:hypothetical protein